MKRALEDAARRQQQSVSALLERIVADSLCGSNSPYEEETALQERLHAAARKTIGAIRSGRSDRSTRVRELVQRKLRQGR